MASLIKALVVDDELYNRDELGHLLSAFPSIDVVGEADSGEAAITKTVQLQPDVVFLDVEMPRMNGMEAARTLLELENTPVIVFATAYPQFAAEAFRYEAIDYLLKPYDQDQLQETVKRIEKRFGVLKEPDSAKTSGKLAVEADGEFLYLDPKDILFISKAGKTTQIVAKKGAYETKTPLKDLESRLAPFHFFRIHKAYLVNLEHVIRLTPWFNGAFHLQLKGSDEMLPVSRGHVKPLRLRLEI